MTPNDFKRMIDHHSAFLAEHCESVVIVATMSKGGFTRMAVGGCGNYYARYGSVMEWLTQQDERTREDERPNEIKFRKADDEDDDSDAWKKGYIGAGV